MNSMSQSHSAPSRGKRAVFYAILFSPLLLIAGVAYHLLFRTSLLQDVYLASWRHLEVPCTQWTEHGYGYKGIPGVCPLNNPEYKTTIQFDSEGFRNLDTKAPADVVLIGDSHTQGFGVNGDQTFAEVLRTKYHLRTRNLGTSSYATQRELEALKMYSDGAKVVVLQYCDNDADENNKSVTLSNEAFLARVHDRWSLAQQRYAQRQQRGIWGGVSDFARALRAGKYKSREQFAASFRVRNLSWEADNFAKTLAKYRSVLEGKKVIVFESSGHGSNHPALSEMFKAASAQAVPGLDVTFLDSSSVLGPSDYYWLDDHLNPQGHQHVADWLAPMIGAALQPGTPPQGQ